MHIDEEQGLVTLALNLTSPSLAVIMVTVITSDGTATGKHLIIVLYTPFVQ